MRRNVMLDEVITVIAEAVAEVVELVVDVLWQRRKKRKRK